MAEVLLFHHAQGLTSGVLEFAEALRRGGHIVHTPDLFDGVLPATFERGIALASAIGVDVVAERGRSAADGLPEHIVYAGFSLGVMPAQLLAQTRPGAAGAVFLHACISPHEFGSDWPVGVPVQIHGMDADPYFTEEGDVAAARELVATTPGAELFLYIGKTHLFSDSSLPDYDGPSAELLTARVLRFLAELA